MTAEHKDLAAGAWKELPLVDQMAHIGGEIERALNWLAKSNAPYSSRAFERALELIDLCLKNDRRRSHLRELARVREVMADYFAGTNQFHSSDASLRSYFLPFALAARKNR